MQYEMGLAKIRLCYQGCKGLRGQTSGRQEGAVAPAGTHVVAAADVLLAPGPPASLKKLQEASTITQQSKLEGYDR